MTSYKTNGECGTIRDQSADFISEFSKVIFHDSSENELIGLHPQLIDACFNGNKEIKSNQKLTPTEELAKFYEYKVCFSLGFTNDYEWKSITY